MLFNTIDFIIFFILVLTTFVIIKNRKFQHLFLLFASYLFFYYSSNYLIILLFYTTLWDFYFGKQIWNTVSLKRKKFLLICSLAGNLSLLGFFKYVDFAITQFNFLGHQFNLGTQIPLLNIALPIGLSFYTFHSITYVVDIYRGKLTPTNSLREYAIFVAFFPQLVAGPIMKARDFLPQLREKIENLETGYKIRQIIINNSNLKLGITMMTIGFLKKMFFADNISPMVNDVFAHTVGSESFTIILGAIGFGIQIYSDFSGYSDIAIGTALIMGFKLPSNFNKPYFAISPSDFWKKWHISLSSWLKEYLYFPLGGNRKSSFRSYLNIFIVMFLGGLWHGASWNFAIWGMLHGMYLVIHKIFSKYLPFLHSHKFLKTKVGTVFSVFITQYLVFLAWIPFRVTSIGDISYSMKKFVFLDLSVTKTVDFIIQHQFSVFLIGLFFMLHFISYKKVNLIQVISNFRLRYWTIFLSIVILVILLFYEGNPENFIYFKF